MTFETEIKGNMLMGHWKVKYGNYTNGVADEGGDIDTGLGNLMGVFLQEKGSSAVANGDVVNESFPDIAGSAVTIVCTAGGDGQWMAVSSQKNIAATTVGEVTIFDRTVYGGFVWAIGKVVDGGDGAVAADLTSAMGVKVSGFWMQPIDTAVSSDQPTVDETMPLDPTQSGGITLATEASKEYLFLACGKK